MRVRLLLAEALRSIGASMSTTAAATVTVLIAMFVLGVSIALGSWVLSWSNHVKGEILVKVFFDQNATPQQINRVRVKLASDERVKSFQFISAAEALERMEKRLPELTRDLPSNPLPPSFEVVPTQGEYGQAIKRSLRPLPPGVEKVRDGGETSKRILHVGRIIESIFLVAVAVLLAAATLLVANTTRLSIFARRRDIEVMKLVGATNWFVRGPFMIEGLLCGLAGSVAAILLLLLGRELALPAILGRIDDSAEVQALAFEFTAAILVAVGLLLGAAGSGLTMRRFLRV